MKIKLACGVLVVLLVLFNLFWNLAGQDIEQWDEARYIASAVEMIHSGDYLVNTYQGQPDYWNSKPPLAYWFVALGYSLGHGNLAAVRLQSPLAVFGICVLMFAWLRARAGFWPALYAVLLLVSMPLFLQNHGARMADADCVFALFVYLAFFLLVTGRLMALTGAYVALGLAFMVKGMEVAPFGLLAWLYSAWLWRRGRLPGSSLLWLPACFLLPIGPWVAARYLRDGLQFFHTMLFIDVVQRAGSGLEGFKSTHAFYFSLLLKAYAMPLLVAGLALAYARDRHRLLREPEVLLLGWFLLPFATFTLSSSRFYWYSYPLLPAFVMLLSLTLARTLGDLPPRALAMAGTLLLGGLVYNEIDVGRHVIHADIGVDEMGRGIRQVAASVAPARATVYLDQPQPLPRGQEIQQRHYAVALLLGNVSLSPGGKPAFLASRGPDTFLVNVRGGSTRRQP